MFWSKPSRRELRRARSGHGRMPRVGAEPLEARRLLSTGPVKLGDEFRINVSTDANQYVPAVASDGAGGFIAAWQDGTALDVYARRLPAAGPPGDEFRANNDSTSGEQRSAAVAATAAGSVVVWQSRGSPSGEWDVMAMRFAADGTPRSPVLNVNGTPGSHQTLPAVAMMPDGGFAVAWTETVLDGATLSTRLTAARLFDADGVPRGPSFLVTTDGTKENFSPAVGVADDGRFIVTWQGNEGGAWSVFARLYSADGTAAGDEFPVTTGAGPDARDPAIAVAPDGSFVVAWGTPGVDLAGGPAGDGSGYGVFARRYGPDGAARGEPFPVNVHTEGDQMEPAAAVLSDGSFVIAWQSAGQDGDALGVYARRFGPDGSPASEDLPVNTFTAGDQYNPSVAATAGGRFLVAWQSAGQDGSGLGVYGQRFAADAPPADPPAVSVADAAASEGGAGAAFIVTLSGARTYPVTVHYATQDGAAASPADYTAASGTLTFAPGETSKTVVVAVADDALDEADEGFSLVLSDPVDATLGRATAAGAIADNDPLPQMTIADSSGVEGDGGDSSEVVFKVTLSAPSGRPITFSYLYGIGGNNTAARGKDYEGVSSVLTFAPGETEKLVVTPIIPDGLYEGPETFTVTIGFVGTPTFSIPDDGAATGTIVDDDVAPRVTVGAVTVTEGNDPAGQLVTVPITLSGPSGLPVTVDYATADGTAVAPGDYASASGTLTFAPGETSKTIQVRVVGDEVEETPTEQFLIKLTNAQGAEPADGAVTVLDDDALPAEVTGVFVNSTAWSPAFRQHLTATGAGSEGLGFLVGGGAAQLDELPWTNLNQLSIRFSRDVFAQAQAVSLRGVAGSDYPVQLAYDADHFILTLNLARPLAADRLTLRLTGTGSATGPDVVRDRLGRPIDGEWAGGADAYPSGDGTVGGDFVFSLNVLPGDVTRDGVVDALDVAEVRSRLSARVTEGGAVGRYSAPDDVNGTGSIDVLDYAQVRARQQTRLPAPPAAASVAVAPRRAPVRRELFGVAPILG